MKHFTSLLFIFLFSLGGYGQSFTTEDNIWIVEESYFDFSIGTQGINLYEYWFEGSEVVNGETYFLLHHRLLPNGTVNSRGLFRESDGGTLFRLDQNVETPILDMNYELGDTTDFLPIDSEVVDFDIIELLDGSTRESMGLSYFLTEEFRFIKGIGNLHQPFYPHLHFATDVEYSLSCFFSNGILLYANEDSGCPYTISSVDSPDLKESLVYYSDGNLYFDNSPADVILQVFSSTGQLIEESILLGQVFELGKIPASIYSYRLLKGDLLIDTGSFLKY